MKLAMRIPTRFPKDASALLVLVAAYLVCASLFFGILQLDVDIGRDFAVADLLLQGRILYHDIVYLYGPFAPWLHFLLLWIFGPSLNVILVAGAVAGLLIVVLTYLIATEVLPAHVALLAGLIVTVQSVYGPDLFSYATPYTFASTYGLVFSMLTLYAASRTLTARLSRWDYLAGASGALALACKQDYAIISLGILASALAVRFYRNPEPPLRAAAAQAISYLAVAGLFAVPIFSKVSLSEFLASVYPKESMVAWRYFYSITTGWGSHPVQRFMNMTRGFLAHFGFVLAATWLLALIAGFVFGGRPAGKLVLIASVAASPFLWHFPFPYFGYYSLLLHLVVLVVAIAGRAQGSGVKVGFLAFCAAIFLFRVLGAPLTFGYASLYFVPSLVVYLYLCYGVALPLLSRFFPERRLQAAMTAVLLLAFVAPEFFAKNGKWAQRAEPVWSERGAFRARGDEAVKARVVLEEIRRYSEPEEKILMIPHGTMYCFLANRRPPSKHLEYGYGHILAGTAETEEIGRLSETPPKLVVIDVVPESQYIPGPVNTFGDAYDIQLGGWIERNYQEVRTISYRGHPVRFLIPRANMARISSTANHGGGSR